MTYDSDTLPLLPPLRPIAEAPVKRGKWFGPCLLRDSALSWFIGLWDGYAWYTTDLETELEPLFYLLLS